MDKEPSGGDAVKRDGKGVCGGKVEESRRGTEGVEKGKNV